MSNEDTLTKSELDTILVLDFGSQYTQLIARRVRELGVYSEIFPWDIATERISSLKSLLSTSIELDTFLKVEAVFPLILVPHIGLFFFFIIITYI